MVLDQFSDICDHPQISENWPRTLRATVPQLHLLVESPLTRHNYNSAAFPKFAEQRGVTAINN